MNTHTSWRLWCLTLGAGALLVAAGYVLYPLTSGPDVIVPASLMIFLGTPPAVMGLVGFQLGQGSRAGVLSWAGTLLTGLGIVLASNSAVLTLANRHALDDTDAYHSSIAGSLEFYGVVAIGLGLIALTIATYRDRVYPRWAARLLVANLVVTLVAVMITPVGDALHTPAPSYLLMASLGLVGLRKTPTAVAAPSREAALSGAA